MPGPRDLQFIGRAYDELLTFPRDVRRRVGRELRRLQSNEEPLDWKPMKTIGPGVSEIRVRDSSGAYRVVYVAKFEEAVFVLRCFEKQSQKTSRIDLEVTTARYKAFVRERSHH